MVKRAAFTFLELIFAIVIIGISVVSLPTMIATTSEGIKSNLVQEAIFAASAQLNQAIAANWDANSLVDGENGGINSLARVIDDGTCISDSSSIQDRRKPGHISRRCLEDNTIGISGLTTTDKYALEDYAGTKRLANEDTSQSGYKYIYSTEITVSQNANFNGTNNANIKMIQAAIYDVSDATTPILLTRLRAYSANIGEPDYYKRTY